MKCSDAKRQILTVLMLIVAFFMGFVSDGIAQGDTGSVTGRVVDLNGNPVVGLPIFIAPLDVEGIGHMRTVDLPYEHAQLHRAHTDLEGRFSITDVPSGPVYIGALPDAIDKRLPEDFEKIVDEFTSGRDWEETTADEIEAFVSSNFGMDPADFEPDVEILFIRVHGLTLYPRTDYDQITFGVKSGTRIKDVKVTVQPRMRVRGRVLFKDGTPLANTRVNLYTHARTINGGSIGFGGDLWTDTKGYFVFYIDEKDDAAYYTFSVEYQGLAVEAEPIRLDPGDRFDGLTLTFDSEPIPPKQPPQKIETDGLEPLSPAWEVPSVPAASHDVWVVNPENGHAYKRVHCETRDDAIAQATKEKAHLVSINDETEQAWLAAVFGHKFYWIGLSRVPTTGALSKRAKKWWQWDNGDPITYANWLPNEFFSEVLDADERDYAVMTLSDGKWYAVSPDSVIWDMTGMAIIEKADVLDNPSAVEK